MRVFSLPCKWPEPNPIEMNAIPSKSGYARSQNKVILLLCLISFSRIYGGVTSPPAILHVDNTHSSIQFTVPFVGITEVSGRFERFCGQFQYDEKNISASRMELFIDASSVNTSLKIRDKDLVNKYLESAMYPVIHFKSNAIRLLNPKQLEVSGELRLHGKMKTIQLVCTIIGDYINNDDGREIGMKIAPVQINRSDYGVMENSTTVGDTITVTSTIRLRDVSPYRKDFDPKYPAVSGQKTTSFLPGEYINDSGSAIKLITYDNRYFLAYSGDEWMWFSELVGISATAFKTTSFSDLVEVQPRQVVFTNQGKSEIFRKKD
jgi:polyisoprenoid-binding protein YceI